MAEMEEGQEKRKGGKGKLLAILEVTQSADPVRDAAERQIASLEVQLVELRRQLGA